MDADDRSLISVIIRDHRRIADLLARLVRRDEDRRRLADELTTVLIRHITAEDLYLYPVAREVVPERLVDFAHHVDIDARVEQILADLAEADPAGNAFDTLIIKLIAESSRAILHEELTVLPWLAKHGDRQTLAALGDVLMAFEDAVAVERTPGVGLTVRFGDRVLHRVSPTALAD